MCLCGEFGELQLLGDFPIGQSLRHERQNLAFALG
jgi:hypothetical protein